jgi:hypothetical protein
MPLVWLQIEFYFWHGCFCKILLDLTLGNYKTCYVRYFRVKPIFGDHVLLCLATDLTINFSELL